MLKSITLSITTTLNNHTKIKHRFTFKNLCLLKHNLPIHTPPFAWSKVTAWAPKNQELESTFLLKILQALPTKILNILTIVIWPTLATIGLLPTLTIGNQNWLPSNSKTLAKSIDVLLWLWKANTLASKCHRASLQRKILKFKLPLLNTNLLLYRKYHSKE